MPGSGREFRYIDMPFREFGTRMSPIAFTITLAEPLTPQGYCHCGGANAAGVKNVPVFSERKRNTKGQWVVVGWHCLMCRCDEHTPETHGRDTSLGAGCGRRCDRGAVSAALRTPFPSFEEWQAEQGAATLRTQGKATPFTRYSR